MNVKKRVKKLKHTAVKLKKRVAALEVEARERRETKSYVLGPGEITFRQ